MIFVLTPWGIYNLEGFHRLMYDESDFAEVVAQQKWYDDNRHVFTGESRPSRTYAHNSN